MRTQKKSDGEIRTTPVAAWALSHDVYDPLRPPVVDGEAIAEAPELGRLPDGGVALG